MHNHYLLNILKGKMNIGFISSKININETYYLKKKIEFNGISKFLPVFFWCFIKNKSLQNGLRSFQDWQISKEIARNLDYHSADVIEFMDIHSEGYVYLRRNSASSRKTKVIIRSHTPWGLLRSFYLNKERKGYDGWWSIDREKFCFQNCDAITVPSMDLKEHLIELYNLPEEKITAIPNIIDTNHFKPLPKIEDNNSFNILHVGRFERPKGVITVIKAFIEFAKINKNCKLIMVGQARGEAYEDCIELLKNANLIERVEYPGFVSYEELPTYYAKVDLVIVASEIYESFSYTVAQAMACSKLVIASKIGGIPETLNHGRCGFLFEPGKEDGLFNKLTYVYNNYDKLLNTSKDARDYAVSKYSQEILAPIYKDYYNLQF